MKKVFLKKGFTLIELLVVISIVSMISTVILASINNAREKASNINVRNTVNAIRTALEMYYDSNGKWPSANDGYMFVYSYQWLYVFKGFKFKPSSSSYV